MNNDQLPPVYHIEFEANETSIRGLGRLGFEVVGVAILDGMHMHTLQLNTNGFAISRATAIIYLALKALSCIYEKGKFPPAAAWDLRADMLKAISLGNWQLARELARQTIIDHSELGKDDPMVKEIED